MSGGAPAAGSSPSATTLLGLVGTPDASFQLDDDDTCASALTAHRAACATARELVAGRPLDDVVTGHREGPRSVRWVHLQVLRELAHQCGHADVLLEQLLAEQHAPPDPEQGQGLGR